MTHEGPLLEVDQLTKHFKPSRAGRRRGDGLIHALCGVSFTINSGETFGVVGESGSGKTTLLRTILGLERPTSGSVKFAGKSLAELKGEAVKDFRRRVSVVFQDPYTSLDPRMTVSDVLSEPGDIQKQRTSRTRLHELLDQVQLPRDSADRFPHEFSGGQRQRIAIARALALNPELIVLDEPVSALDVSVQAEILALLQELQAERQVSYLFVAHDLAVVADLSHRVGVMFGGQMVESGTTEQVIGASQHPYTRELLSAVPVPDPVVERAKPRSLARAWPSADEPAAACPIGEVL